MYIKNFCKSLLVCGVALSLLSSLGCASVWAPILHNKLTTQENTDLFPSPEAIQSAYDQVAVKKTTLSELARLGFRLEKGTKVGSSTAYGLLHKSEPQINVVVNDAKEYAETQKRIAAEKAGLEAYVFVYKNISGTQSRVYISKKKTTAKGYDCQYLFIIKDGVVIHKEYDKKHISESKSDSALFQGLIGPAIGAAGLGRSFL